MRLRVRDALALVLMFSVWIAGCAGHKHPKPAPFPATPPRTVVGPFSLPSTVRVIAFHTLPEGFSTSIPPVWSADGRAVSLLRIAPDGGKVVRFDGASLSHETPFDLGLGSDGKNGASPVSLLAFAIDPQGTTLAVAIDDPADGSVKVFVRSLAPNAAVNLVARFPGQVDEAALAWMGESDLLLGLGPTRAAESAAASAEFAGLYRLGVKVRGDNSQFVIDCKQRINSGRFLLSAGRRRALAGSSAGGSVFLLDFDRFECRRVGLPGLAQIRVLGWSAGDASILYASALSARYSDMPAVFEFELGKNRRRLIGAPIADAVYTKRGTIAIPGSLSLRPATFKLRPDRLVLAQVGIVDQSASETTIFPLGLWTSGALLAQAAIGYSASADALAIEIPVPIEKTFTPVIVGFSVSSRRVESIAGAQLNRLLLYNWGPSGSRLAICDCAGEAVSVLVVEPPLK